MYLSQDAQFDVERAVDLETFLNDPGTYADADILITSEYGISAGEAIPEISPG